MLSGIEVYLGPWLKTHFDFTSMNIGNYWGVFSLLITISQLGLSRLLKAKTAMIVGFFVFGLSQIMLLLSESSLYLLYFNTVLMAFAMGIIFPSINVSISSEGKKNQQGLIFGINQSVGSIGRILGPLLLGFAYAIEPNYAWILVGVLSILTGIFTIFFLKDNN